jgi:hypothetical protein
LLSVFPLFLFFSLFLLALVPTIINGRFIYSQV